MVRQAEEVSAQISMQGVVAGASGAVQEVTQKHGKHTGVYKSRRYVNGGEISGRANVDNVEKRGTVKMKTAQLKSPRAINVIKLDTGVKCVGTGSL